MSDPWANFTAQAQPQASATAFAAFDPFEQNVNAKTQNLPTASSGFPGDPFSGSSQSFSFASSSDPASSQISHGNAGSLMTGVIYFLSFSMQLLQDSVIAGFLQ